MLVVAYDIVEVSYSYYLTRFRELWIFRYINKNTKKKNIKLKYVIFVFLYHADLSQLWPVICIQITHYLCVFFSSSLSFCCRSSFIMWTKITCDKNSVSWNNNNNHLNHLESTFSTWIFIIWSISYCSELIFKYWNNRNDKMSLDFSKQLKY